MTSWKLDVEVLCTEKSVFGSSVNGVTLKMVSLSDRLPYFLCNKMGRSPVFVMLIRTIPDVCRDVSISNLRAALALEGGVDLETRLYPLEVTL